MNTNSLKRFAKDARIKLLDQVGRKLEFVLTHDTAELRGKEAEITQLKNKIAEHGKEQVIETVAYTWFNRLMALRFMDANGYTIPKVVTPLPGMTNPEILQNVLGGNIEPVLQIDRQRLNDLLDGKTAATDAHTEAYKMLLVASCNQWHTAMPFMFERISDYTELLLPDDLLSDYSVVADIRNGMSDEDCQQEELIGWLYQFYITDKKDDVFEGLKKNIKITAENIPAATQLFTPRWIVRYMVENTLGKLWLTLKPNSKLRQHMPYFIEAPEGNAPAPLPEGIKGVTDITFLDPCQGSGHILVYAFDLFTKFYEEEGYNTNEIPALIFEYNLFGIDIDERAAQLAAFALTMKARSYYSRFLRKPVQPNVLALENVSEETIRQSVKLPITVGGKRIAEYRDLSLHLLTQADNFGSLIQIAPEEAKAIQIQEGSIWQDQQQKLKEQANYLSRQYHCVVTNPPYMGSGGFNDRLKDFVEGHYYIGRADLMTCFMERAISLIVNNGIYAMINLPSWLFLNSFKDLRDNIIKNQFINSLVHLGRGVFGSDFGSVTFVISKTKAQNNYGVYRRLFDKHVQVRSVEIIEELFLRNNFNVYTKKQMHFEKVPNSTFAYWLSDKFISLFENGLNVKNHAKVCVGLQTGGNDRFRRYWFEISLADSLLNTETTSNKKWVPYNSGGEFRKWYGNHYYVVNWKNNGEEIKSIKPKSVVRNPDTYFKSSLSWSKVTAGGFSLRYFPDGFIYDVAGCSIFAEGEDFKLAIIGVLNSPVMSKIYAELSGTVNFEVGQISKFPLTNEIKETNKEILDLITQVIQVSKTDWDSRELSWNFSRLKILEHNNSDALSRKVIDLFKFGLNNAHDAQKIEERINSYFINSYGLEREIGSEVGLGEITLDSNPFFKYGLGREISEYETLFHYDVVLDLLSYSVNCIFGRYSLDKPGLIVANQGETLQDFLVQIPNPTFMPDEDNIIPVLEGEWFKDDIVGRFKVFLKAAFGEEHFEENLKYIEDTIGKDIRKYFVKDFYNDHIKRYKKRPIYWMFSSPKGHFKALIYMHRYQPDLCSKLLNDYLQTFIGKLEAKKQDEIRLSLREDISAREKTAAIKEIDKLELMLKDCRDYEKTLFAIATQKIAIDLDDGVKVNYQKFKDVLVPIKGLEKEED